jgi:prepilin-type N-terminal cleavage/methylation domain-containing protein
MILASEARSRTPRRGLSLLEVLLALTILLMSMSAIGQLVDIGTDRGVEARLHSQASRLVQAKMAEVEAGVVPLDSSGTGSFDNEPEWTWTVEPVSQDAPNVYQVTVKVSRDLKGRPFEVSLTQFIFDPTKMGTALPAQKAADPSTSTTSGTTGGM